MIVKTINEGKLDVIQFKSELFPIRCLDVYEDKRVMHKRCLQYEDHMYQKYRHAMFFPWLPVDPDPVAPPDPLCDGFFKKHAVENDLHPWFW